MNSAEIPNDPCDDWSDHILTLASRYAITI